MRGTRTSGCPRDLYRPKRQNSRGIEFGERAALDSPDRRNRIDVAPVAAAPLIDGKAQQAQLDNSSARSTRTTAIGSVIDATPENAREASSRRSRDFKEWSRTPAEMRAEILERAADLLEQRTAHFIALLQREGGKTLDDALSEVREAVDFCRYYAAEGRELFGDGEAMPGPTGESNALRLRGRGVFVAISPWNFPLAIFTGPGHGGADGRQCRRRKAGRTDAADRGARRSGCCMRPACRRRRCIWCRATAAIGAALSAHPDIAGVVFTGSTEVARSINRALAAKDGPIVPLIAETGGINAMIVDATALPEQVADDVVTSAFRSAGQRCSALRLLFVQDDVADRMIEMIAGAARELEIGDPRDPATHIGPVIDAEAKQRLEAHIARMKREARRAFRRERARRQLRRAAYFRTVRCRPTDRGSVRPDPACGALPRRPARRACCNRSSAPATG